MAHSSGMDVFVAGATGRTGRAVIAAALAGCHRVTAFVRRRDGLPDDVTIVEGDITDAPAVAPAVTVQVVISTLGGEGLAAGTTNLIAAGGRRIHAVVAARILQADEQQLRNQL